MSTGEHAAIKVIKLEQGDDFGIIQQEILMMKARQREIVNGTGRDFKLVKLTDTKDVLKEMKLKLKGRNQNSY